MQKESLEAVNHTSDNTKKLPAVTSREERIKIVNEIIKEIASRSRNFFAGKYGIAEIFLKNGRLYMKNEYSGLEMCLATKFGYPPKAWHHGGTLWGLTKDFKDFIITGEMSNHNNGYGGLYSPHWGYSETDMVAIQEKAKLLGYLHVKASYLEAENVAEFLVELRKYRDKYKIGSKERMEYNGVCDKLDILASHLLNGF